jgi:hypothetical protein
VVRRAWSLVVVERPRAFTRPKRAAPHSGTDGEGVIDLLQRLLTPDYRSNDTSGDCGNHQEPDKSRNRKRHRYQSAEYPTQLEPRFKLRKRRTTLSIVTLALHERIKREARHGCRETDRSGDKRGFGGARMQGGQARNDCDHQRGAEQDTGFTNAVNQLRRNDRTQQTADNAGSRDETQPPVGDPFTTEAERHQKGNQTDETTLDRHGQGRKSQGSAVLVIMSGLCPPLRRRTIGFFDSE